MVTSLAPPKNSKAEILAALITEREISERSFRLNGFRSRLVELRRLGIPIQSKFVTKKNRHGHPCTYKVRYLFSLDVPKAKKLYAQIND